jgi:hypothetical protein
MPKEKAMLTTNAVSYEISPPLKKIFYKSDLT